MATLKRESKRRERAEPKSSWTKRRRRFRARPLSPEAMRALGLTAANSIEGMSVPVITRGTLVVTDQRATKTPEPESLLLLVEEVKLLRKEVASLRVDGGKASVLDLDEAAAFLGMSRRSLERRIAEGKIRTKKLGPGQQGSRRVLRSELERYLEERPS